MPYLTMRRKFHFSMARKLFTKTVEEINITWYNMYSGTSWHTLFENDEKWLQYFPFFKHNLS